MKDLRRCQICLRPYPDKPKRYFGMCEDCGESYDRYAFRDVSVMGAIIWAARRSRRYDRLRRRAAPKHEEVIRITADDFDIRHRCDRVNRSGHRCLNQKGHRGRHVWSKYTVWRVDP